MASKYKLITLVVLSLFLFACNSGTPKCDSDDAKNLVIKIATNELKKNLGPDIDKQLKLSVSDVITKNHNEKLDQYSCSANIYMIGVSGQKTVVEAPPFPITYTVEKTDDGKKIFVNVYGLYD